MDIETSKINFLITLDNIQSKGTKLFLCPFVEKSKGKRLCYVFVCILLLFTTVQLFFTLILTEFSDMMEIINIAPNIGACVMSNIKFVIIYNHGELYDEIYRHFCEDLWEVLSNQTCRGKNIGVFIKYTNISMMINKTITLLCVTLIVVVDSLPFLLMTYENKVLGEDLEYLYPFDAWYPFDKVKWYSVAYIWESFMTAVVICIYAFANVVHLTYIAYICMELMLLGNLMEGLINQNDVKNIIHRKQLNETHDRIKKNLKYIIKRHIYLKKISSGLDNILGDVMLLCYTFGSVFICLTAFSSTVVDDRYKSIRYFSFFLSLIVEMFNQCIIGQVLIDHSVALSEKIYSSDWIYADPETKKIILMLLFRTQKPFKLTANQYVTMDLNTFSRICSTSYQFFNLLRTVYHP